MDFLWGVVAGVAGLAALRELFKRMLLVKLRHDVRRLGDGDATPLLAGYADRAVLRFNGGQHRWSGVHEGKDAIRAFLAEFTNAGLRGSVRDLWIGGPPWALTLLARFDDHATGPKGEVLYENRTLLLVRTRWGRIVEQEDFYEDTARIEDFDRRLTELGIEPVAGRRD